jgi:hypothetical protein
MGQIVFYQGNGGSQNIVHTADDSPGQDFQPDTNDQARSLSLRSVRPGCVISVYDSSDASTNSDWCRITVRQTHPDYIVGSFERSFEDEYVRVDYFRNTGLDGKVSRVHVR